MDPMSFLESVSGFTSEQNQSAASKPVRLGTIDPAYVSASFPGTQPLVTFDGESTLSGKAYKVLAPGYRPTAGDRVVLLPCGVNNYVIVGSLTSAASAYVGGSLTVAGAAALASLTIGGNALDTTKGNFIEYGRATAGIVAAATTATEVAIPAASWSHEPSLTFTNGRMYRIETDFGMGLGASVAAAGIFKIRKGSASITGQILGFCQHQDTSNLAFTSRSMRSYVQNISGANIVTALSLTVIRVTAAATINLYGDAANVPLVMAIQDVGPASGHAMAPVSVSIV